MGTLVVLVLLAVAGWVVWKLFKKPDMNNDGVVDAKDVVAAAKEVAVEATETPAEESASEETAAE